MSPIRRVVLPLRILLATAFAALVLAQPVALPAALRQMAEGSPGLAHLSRPLLAFGVLELLCVQVVLGCTWKLLAMVDDDRIFSEESSTWVDAILWTIAAAWVLLLGASVHLAVVGGLPGPAGLLLLVLLLVGAALGLLVVVMRALLRQATMLRTDMEAVI